MRVFISYRREQELQASTLRDSFRRLRGEDSVFSDHQLRHQPGVLWREVLREQVALSTHLLVVVAEGWPTADLYTADDPVRAELLDAHAEGLIIVPVLFGGVAFPSNLPEELSFFKEFNAATISTSKPTDDCEALVLQLSPDDQLRYDVIVHHLGSTPVASVIALQQLLPELPLTEIDAIAHPASWPVAVLTDADNATALAAQQALSKAGAAVDLLWRS